MVNKIESCLQACADWGLIPTSFRQCMTWEEQVLWLTKFLQQTVIPTLNGVIDETNDLYGAFQELKVYVDEYFENLDVQEEINNKLDEMAEDGTLERIFGDYFEDLSEQLRQEVQAELSAQDARVNSRLSQQDIKIGYQDAQIANISSAVTASTSGAPLAAASTSEMTDTSRIYVNTTDGKWYYYDGDSWEIGGTYQASVDADATTDNSMVLNGASDNVTLTYDIEWTDGKWLTNQGELQNETSDHQSTSNYLPITNLCNLTFHITDTLDYTGVCYYDKDKVWVGINKRSINQAKAFTVPANAAFFRYCCMRSQKSGIYPIVTAKIDNRIEKLERTTNLFNERKYLDKNIKTNVEIGATVNIGSPESVDRYTYFVYDCQEGDIFKIKGYAGNNPRLWAFVDANNALLSKSDNLTTFSTQYCVAPKNAAKIIINIFNNSHDDFGIYKLTNNSQDILQNGYNLCNEITSTNQGVRTGYNTGVLISLTPDTYLGWSYLILPCNEGNRFYIRGNATANDDRMRLWAFVTESNRIITHADLSLNGEYIITAPPKTAKLIVNFNVGDKELYALDVANVKTLSKELSLVNNYETTNTPPDKAGCAFYRGLKLRQDMIDPLVDFKKSEDLMCHVGTFKIVNNVVYATYYGNETSSLEDPSHQIVRFVHAPLNNLSNKTYHTIQSCGDTFDGKTVTQIYDTILAQVDATHLMIMWTAQLDYGAYYRLYQVYDISNTTFGNISYNYFKVGDSTLVFSTDNMYTQLLNVEHPPITGDIGIMQTFTSRTEDDVEVYYTGCYATRFNCIIKSTDFITWEYVAQPDFKNDGLFENACYVLGNRVYYYLRQNYNSQYSLLSYFDLNTGKWHEPVQVDDAQSRGCFFKVGNDLYLAHAPKDRDSVSFMLINKDSIERSYEYTSANVYQAFYPYVDTHDDDLYMIYTQERRHMYFSKVTLGDNNFNVSNALYTKLYD